MKARKRLPLGLVSRQNGDPRFVPPVALGAKYSKQLQGLQSKVKTLTGEVESARTRQIVSNQQISNLLAKLSTLKADDVDKLSNNLVKLQKKIETMDFDLKEAKLNLTRCEDEKKRLVENNEQLLQSEEKEHKDEIDKLSLEIESLETQIMLYTAEIKKKDSALDKLGEQYDEYVKAVNRADVSSTQGGLGKRKAAVNLESNIPQNPNEDRNSSLLDKNMDDARGDVPIPQAVEKDGSESAKKRGISSEHQLQRVGLKLPTIHQLGRLKI